LITFILPNGLFVHELLISLTFHIIYTRPDLEQSLSFHIWWASTDFYFRF